MNYHLISSAIFVHEMFLLCFYFREIKQSHSRIQNGLNKIEETNVLVEHMKLELVALEPELKQKSSDTMELLEKLAIDQNSADEVSWLIFHLIDKMNFVSGVGNRKHILELYLSQGNQ